MSSLSQRMELLADAEQNFAIAHGIEHATDSFILFIDNEPDFYDALYEAKSKDRIIAIQRVRRVLAIVISTPFYFARWRKFMEFYELKNGVTGLLLFHVNVERVASHIVGNMGDR